MPFFLAGCKAHHGRLPGSMHLLEQTRGRRTLHSFGAPQQQQAPPHYAYAVDLLGSGLGSSGMGAAATTSSCPQLRAPFTNSFVVPAGMWGTPRQLVMHMGPRSTTHMAFGLELQLAGSTVGSPAAIRV